jgi:predicted dehydrogenase
MLAADPSARFLVHGTHGSFRKFGVDPQEPTLLNTNRRPPMLGSDEPGAPGQLAGWGGEPGAPGQLAGWGGEPWLPEPESAWGTVTLPLDLTQPTEFTRTHVPTIPGDYRQFYANVRDAILGKAPLAVPAEDGYRTLRILDLARESDHQRQTLPVTFD